MRRLLSMLLVALFSLPFAMPLLAAGQDPEAGLPACCRRNGTHHCNGRMGEQGTLQSPHAELRAPAARCPYTPGAAASAQPNPLAPPVTAVRYGGLFRHPNGPVQSAFCRRTARDRSRPKRGPPTHLPL